MPYIVATDTFLSRWGQAPGRSLYAVEVSHDYAEQCTVLENMKRRSDFKRVRFNLHLPRVRKGDDLTIATRETAPRYFIPGGIR